MAIYCGACASRIDSAPENEGSFQTSGENFGGWDVSEQGRSRIDDTCSACAPILRAAVTAAAKIIAKRNGKRVSALKKEITDVREKRERFAQEDRAFKAEFEEWRRKKK
jgi:hypothetical protein